MQLGRPASGGPAKVELAHLVAAEQVEARSRSTGPVELHRVAARTSASRSRRCRCAATTTGTPAGRTSAGALGPEAPATARRATRRTGGAAPARLGAPDVLVVHEVLEGVDGRVDRRQREERRAGCARSRSTSFSNGCFLSRAISLSVSPDRAGTAMPGRAHQAALADEQVADQVLDVPVAAQGGRVRARRASAVSQSAWRSFATRERGSERGEADHARSIDGGREWPAPAIPAASVPGNSRGQAGPVAGLVTGRRTETT